MNSPGGDPNKKLNHIEKKSKVDKFPAVWQFPAFLFWDPNKYFVVYEGE